MLAEPANAEARRDVAIAQERLGDLARSAGNPEEAEKHFRRSLELWTAMGEADPNDLAVQRSLGIQMDRLAQIAMARGDFPTARGMLDRGTAIARRIVAANPGSAQAQRDLEIALGRQGDLAVGQQELPRAEAAYVEAMSIAQALATADPQDREKARDVSLTLMKRAMLRLYQQRPAEAVTDMQQVLEQRRGEFKRAPEARSQRDLAFALNGLGMSKAATGDLNAAQRDWRECLALLETLPTRTPADQALIDLLRKSLDPKPPG